MQILSKRFFPKAATLLVAAFLSCLLLLVPDSPEAAARRSQAAPAFKAFSLDGKLISTENLLGNVVLLDFWATWCPPCRESIPYLKNLHNRYADQGLKIVGMSMDDGGARIVKSYVEKQKIPYQIVMASNKVAADYGVRALPVLYLIDKQGQVREFFMGFSDQAGKVIEAQIRQLLAE